MVDNVINLESVKDANAREKLSDLIDMVRDSKLTFAAYVVVTTEGEFHTGHSEINDEEDLKTLNHAQLLLALDVIERTFDI